MKCYKVLLERSLWIKADFTCMYRIAHTDYTRSYPVRILGIVFLYSAVKHLLSRICHSLAGNI